MQHCNPSHVETIISAAGLADKVGISRASLARYMSRRQILPHFKTASSSFFRYDAIEEAKNIVQQNRIRNYRHLSVVT